jgi:hypothetical protein
MRFIEIDWKSESSKMTCVAIAPAVSSTDLRGAFDVLPVPSKRGTHSIRPLVRALFGILSMGS